MFVRLDTFPSERAVLSTRILELENQLRDSDAVLNAIKTGDVDALVINNQSGEPHVYTLNTNEQPYRILIEQMKEGALTVRRDGAILYCNRRFADLLDIPAASIIGRSLQSFTLGENAEALTQLLEQATQAGGLAQLTLSARTGRRVPVELSVSLLPSDYGLDLLCCVIRDESERLLYLRNMAVAHVRLLEETVARGRAEDALHHAQKLEAIGRLAAGVAHDFNNILQSIVGCLELIMDDLVDGAPAREFTCIALDATRRGSALTGQLLSYAGKQMLMPRAVNLAPFLADLRLLLGRSLDPRITIELRVEGAPHVMVDPGQLQTALLNLAINASHAMPQGGALSIDVCGPQTDDPWVVLTVTDAGVGMDAATLAQATEPFFTTKGPNGTGLGLSMVQGFVAQSGGKMRIVSAPDRGTKVELCLPSCAGGRLKENPEMVSHVGLGRILLVDDSRDVLLATGALLQKHGYTVTMAAGGRKALALLADGDCFDALVTDYAMPEMTGVDLIAECRVAFPGLPAVIITGFAHLDSIEALGTGALVLQKPFHSSELLQALSLAMKPA